MNVGKLCTRSVVIAEPDLSVLEAAHRMREHHVGDLVVVEAVEGGNEPVGVVTDRDLVLQVLAQDIDWAKSLRVSDVMTCELITASEDEDASSVLQTMRDNGVRRVPVINQQGLLEGIVTYDDLLEWLVEELGGLVAVVGNQKQVETERTSRT